MKFLLLMMSAVVLLTSNVFAITITNNSPATVFVEFKQNGQRVAFQRMAGNTTAHPIIADGHYDIVIDYPPRLIYQNQFRHFLNNFRVTLMSSITVNSAGLYTPLVVNAVANPFAGG